MEEDSITGHLLLCFLSISNNSLAKPKLPCINSAVSFGRFTPARLNTKSEFSQKPSSNDFSVSISYSKISSIFSERVLSLPSRMFFSAAQRFLPTKPLAPVTSMFIILPLICLQFFYMQSRHHMDYLLLP